MCRVYVGGFGTATNVNECCSLKKRMSNLKQTIHAEKAHLGKNVKIGTYRHYKNSIRSFLNPEYELINQEG